MISHDSLNLLMTLEDHYHKNLMNLIKNQQMYLFEFQFHRPDGLLRLPDRGQDKGLARVIPVCPHAEVHFARIGVLLESLVHADDGIGWAHLHARPETARTQK